MVVGISQELSDHSQIEIRDILSLESPIPLLAPYQIQLILMIATKYLLPIHKVLQIFLSRPLVRRLQKYTFPLEPIQSIQKTTKNKHTASIITQEIVQKKHIEPYLEDGTVIVVPDDIFLSQLKNTLDSEEDIGFFFDDLTDIRKAQFWIDTYNKKNKIIIWTRRVLYYNLSRYSQIVYLEDAFGSKYYHYPIHIQYLDILAYISGISHFDITLLTSLPKLTTLHNFRHFTWNNI